MIDMLANQLGFLGNFHPIAVHFPLALLPVALGIKVWGHQRRDLAMIEVSDSLLKLSLLFALLAALLGITNAQANGYAWSEVQNHAAFAWATILILAITLYWPEPGQRNGGLSSSLTALGSAALKGLRWLGWLVKWVLMIVLFPVTLAFLLLRAIYRRTLAPSLNPRFGLLWDTIKHGFRAITSHVARYTSRRNMNGLGYATAFTLIMITGLHGGNLLHGKGHLAKHAPDWAAPLLGGVENTVDAQAFNSAYFDKAVTPILRKNCMKCHGEDKAKGDLQLHTVEHIVKAGVVTPKAPMDSEMIRRVLLSRDDPGAMPPAKNGRGLNSEEVAVLLAWINDEVSGEAGGGEHGPVIPPYYLSLSQSLPPLGDNSIQSLNLHGAYVVRVQESHPLIDVNLQFVSADQLPAVLAALQPYQRHVVDLNVAGQTVDARLIDAIRSMPNLTRLNMSRSNATDAHVQALAELRRLRWLNLYGTRITEGARDHLNALHQLQTLHVGGTALDPASGAG